MPKPLRVSPSDSSSTTEVRGPRTQGRRSFSAAQKRRILSTADACAHGELGPLLRREGVYSSQLTAWRRQLAAEGGAGLEPQRPGPTPKLDVKDREILALGRKVNKLEKELGIAHGLVELQKKVQALLAQMHQDDPPCTR